MSRAHLGLGTNLGDRAGNLRQAIRLLSEEAEILRQSSVYETEPVGFADQPWFLNMAVEAETGMAPDGLLRFAQSVENAMGRVRTIANGPRIIDIDILLYGDERVESERLTLPHPRMLQRAFAMVPLYEISPGLVISGRRIGDIMANFSGERIRRLGGLDELDGRGARGGYGSGLGQA
jgi:2-amino-4-hydroxy-6-hydroxymethyldihydropteridine diphosphokinase